MSHDQRSNHATGQRIADRLAEPQRSRLERIGGDCRPGEYRLEHDEQDRGQDQRAEQGVEQDRVELVRDPPHRGFADDRADRNVAGAALKGQRIVDWAVAGADLARR